ncbi:MAG TPA: hypothetical protein VM327_02550 [Candidatus Thermoplasmatota archaeon]|nr:hypothetical protein [Candidatus Thermoplasmatota archaeon]
MPSDNPDRTPRRITGGRLAGVLALALLGAAAFLLLLDVIYDQDDPRAPWFTGQLSQTAAATLLACAMGLLLVGEIAILLPRRDAQAPWSPGTTCLECGTWVERPTADGPCPSCGKPLQMT